MGTNRQPAASRVHARELAVMVNVVTAYQRIRLRLDADTLTIDAPIAWLGVVPHGRRVIDLPRAGISVARIAPTVFPSRLIVAAALVALPWLVPLPAAIAVLSSVLAFLFLLLSVVASIRVEMSNGERHIVPVCWFERGAVVAFLADLEGGAS
jgi:hypothetical protein